MADIITILHLKNQKHGKLKCLVPQIAEYRAEIKFFFFFTEVYS